MNNGVSEVESNLNKKVATKVWRENGVCYITYYKTNVVSFNDAMVTLDTGGYETLTTKRRMNQAAEEFDLGFSVYQENYMWYVDHWTGEKLEFGYDSVLEFARKPQ